jgi:hypothetical protein
MTGAVRERVHCWQDPELTAAAAGTGPPDGYELAKAS